MAEAATALDPDLFVLYLGNNEVTGPFGPGTVFTSTSPPRLGVGASIWMRKSRVGQLLRRAKGAFSPATSQVRGTGMEVFVDRPVAEDDPAMDRVYESFRSNLEAICDLAKSNGVPVVLATVGTNLRHSAPFASLSVSKIEDILGEELELRQSGDYRGAAQKMHAAVELAPDCAEVHYRLGRLQLALGDTLVGRQELIRARDLDSLRFRADSRIESIIAEVARDRAKQGVHFVDVAADLDRGSSYGIAGREFFLDHVHLDLRGNHAVASALGPAVEAALSATRSDWSAAESSDKAGGLSVSATAQYLAYTPWTRSDLLRQVMAETRVPPFVNQSDHEEQLGRLKSEVQSLDTLLGQQDLSNLWPIYAQSLRRHPGDGIRIYEAARFLQSGLKDPERAESLWREVTRILPHFAAAWNSLADCVAAQSRPAEAREFLERSLDLDPAQPQVLWNLARLLESSGNPGAATQRLRELLRLAPENVAAQRMLEKLDRR